MQEIIVSFNSLHSIFFLWSTQENFRNSHHTLTSVTEADKNKYDFSWASTPHSLWSYKNLAHHHLPVDLPWHNGDISPSHPSHSTCRLQCCLEMHLSKAAYSQLKKQIPISEGQYGHLLSSYRIRFNGYLLVFTTPPKSRPCVYKYTHTINKPSSCCWKLECFRVTNSLD